MQNFEKKKIPKKANLEKFYQKIAEKSNKKVFSEKYKNFKGSKFYFANFRPSKFEFESQGNCSEIIKHNLQRGGRIIDQ